MFNLWQSKEANLKEHKIMIIMERTGKDKNDSVFRDTAVQERTRSSLGSQELENLLRPSHQCKSQYMRVFCPNKFPSRDISQRDDQIIVYNNGKQAKHPATGTR